MELEEYRDQIVTWLRRGKYGDKYKIEDFTHINRENDVVVLNVVLYTDRNAYWITVHPSALRAGDSYLGCTMTSRKPRAGEDWTRGNDLTDGRFCKDTWDNIVADILTCELVDIKRPVKYKYEGCSAGKHHDLRDGGES